MKKTKKNIKKAVNNNKLYTLIISITASFVALVTLLTLALSLGWLGNPVVDDDGVARLDYSETSTSDEWEASYAYLDGRMKKEFSIGKVSKSLVLEFETESGEMNVMVYDKATGVAIKYNGSPFYFDNVGNASYRVTVSSDVVVRLDAEEHRGRFSIRVE